jgi:hypothetical protein
MKYHQFVDLAYQEGKDIVFRFIIEYMNGLLVSFRGCFF